mgnify:CR=1 FL=1
MRSLFLWVLLAVVGPAFIVLAVDTQESVRAEITDYRVWVDSFTVTLSTFNGRIVEAGERLYRINAAQITQLQQEIEAAQEQIRLKQEQIEALKK